MHPQSFTIFAARSMEWSGFSPSPAKFRHMEDQLINSDGGALITVDIATAPD